MGKIESKSSKINKSEDRKPQEDFDRLQNIAKALKKIGLQVFDNLITIGRLEDPTSEMGFPIVKDGANGIRASYSKREGLKIWFTNGFENPNNPKRQEIEGLLKEKGLL